MPEQSANKFVVVTQTVAVPGTAVQVAQNFAISGLPIVVTGRYTNTGNMYVGRTALLAQGATTREVIAPGRSADFWVDSSDRLFVDSDNSVDSLEIRIPMSAG